MKILVYLRELNASHKKRIQAAADELGCRAVIAETKEELIKHGADAEILFAYSAEEAFAAVPNVKWAQTSGAGIEKQLFPAMMKSGAAFTNAAGVYASQAAEHAFALLLALTRGLRVSIPRQERREWFSTRSSVLEIAGWTLGVIGMGGFGREMAKRAKGFEMRVIAVDPYCAEKPANVDELLPGDRLPELLGRSDAAMLACPLTRETERIVDADALSRMKRTAYLINVARGRLVDEAALCAALQSGQIAGAGLDVMETEPLPPESPLWEMENVILTSHSAGYSQRRTDRMVELFCDNLRRYLRGEPLRNVVRKELGF